MQVSALSVVDAERAQEYLWRQALGGAVIGQPVVQARSLALITDGGSLRAYSLAGRPLWNFSARGRLGSFLTRSREGASYVARVGGTLIAVSGSGRELWRADLGGDLFAPVVLGWDGRVFAPTERGVSCFTASGTLLWRRDFDHRISAGPWLDCAGGILLSLENGEVLRIGPFGEIAGWRLPSAPSFLVSVEPAPGVSAVLSLHDTGDVRSIDPSTPNADPSGLPRLPSAPVAVAGGDSGVAVVLSNGQTLMLSAGGEVLWTADSHVRAGRPGGVAVIYDERGVYVLSPDGATGFAGDGRRLWTTTLRNVSGLPAFGDNGVLYSGGTNWILYAWRLEDRILPQRRNPPGGSYGTGDPPPSFFSTTPMRFNGNMVSRELDTIQRGIHAGRVGGNELEWIAFLKETAGGDVRPGGDARLRIEVSHRIRALQLLSRIGSSQNVPWLAELFRREQNPAVMSAAANAIGGIGLDPGGVALGEFAAAVNSGGLDERVLVSVAAATGAVCRGSGGALYDAGVRLLVTLGSPGQPLAVQRQARLELESLR
ncbi:MAG: PQQ-binding-like beta-propeller repeat protein [Treponema sp.]|nr:PQQ-binding-like beta-propeller repeat protein [Treponema sp.]